jgi:cardiolipin synthase
VATLVALAVRQIIPWWLVAVLAVRELTVGVALALLKRQAGYGTLQVSLVGKAATLCLLYAFPLLFLGDHPGWGGTLARVIGWAFATWGTVLYWWAAMLYLAQVRTLVSRSARPEVGVAGPLASGPARGSHGAHLGAETGKGAANR